MSDGAEGAVCIEIVVAPDEHGLPFSSSGVLFLRASVRACARMRIRRVVVICRCRTACLLQVGRRTSTKGQVAATFPPRF
jgi:hypothetical protein